MSRICVQASFETSGGTGSASFFAILLSGSLDPRSSLVQGFAWIRDGETTDHGSINTIKSYSTLRTGLRTELRTEYVSPRSCKCQISGLASMDYLSTTDYSVL